MKFVVGGKREKPHEKPTQTPVHPPENPHGVTEARTRDPSGGRQAPKCLRHEAARVKTTILREKKKMIMIAFDASIIEINASEQCDF